jgi:hypothetical protein
MLPAKELLSPRRVSARKSVDISSKDYSLSWPVFSSMYSGNAGLRRGDGGLGRLLPKITARVSLVVETIDSFLYLLVDVVSGWRHFRLRQTGLRFIYT